MTKLGPHMGHALCPFVTWLEINPYAGKSFTIHKSILRSLKVLLSEFLCDPSTQSIPSHSYCSSLINGAKYTSTFFFVTLSFPGMSSLSIMKKFLVTSQGGRL